MKKALLIMGSDSDLPIVKGAADILQELGVEYEAHISSAHRSAKKTEELAENAHSRGFGVIIAAAGGAAHLAGVIAAYSPLPVIALPISSAALSGLDSLLSMVQMPPGIPCATVAIDGAKNAGILAAQILALGDEELFERIAAYKAGLNEAVCKKDEELAGLSIAAYLAQKK